LDYFVGLDISMDETHVRVLDRDCPRSGAGESYSDVILRLFEIEAKPMPTPYDERAEQTDLDLVAAYLTALGLSAERILKQPGKTPDFRVRMDGAIVAYCEVKAPQEDNWLGVRKDPTNERLVRFLKQAVEQFNAVNPSRAELNILAFVNHKGGTRYADLDETLTGYFLASDGRSIPTMRPPAEVSEVDIYLWFEGRSLCYVAPNYHDPERGRRACALLGLREP
jgi:hypothetical protein